LVTEARVCKRRAQGCHLKAELPGISLRPFRRTSNALTNIPPGLAGAPAPEKYHRGHQPPVKAMGFIVIGISLGVRTRFVSHRYDKIWIFVCAQKLADMTNLIHRAKSKNGKVAKK